MSTPLIPTRDEFAGKVALITGGTNGLGRHLAHALVSLGAEVFFCGRRVEAGRTLEKEWGRLAHFVPCELGDVQSAQDFAKAAGAHLGRIDYVINNAAIDPRIAFENASMEDFDRVIAVNLRSFYFVSQAALPFMQAGEGKSIVNICTTNYMLGVPTMTIYGAAKSGIIGLSRAMARDLGLYGIRVNVVSPGWVRTDRQVTEHHYDSIQKQLLDEQCLKFTLLEDHITPATLFLLSKAAGAITGQNLVVDAGKVLQ